MNRTIGLRLAFAVLALIAAPLAAQAFSEGYTFLKAVRERDGATAEGILSNPASTAVNARDSSSGEGALHILVRGRDLTWLSFMLSRGARPDLQNNEGSTPLLLASQIGWVDGARELLARRANPNLGNRRGETPLIFAVLTRDVAMVRVLLAGRANPNQTDHVSGNSALDYARQDARSAQILRLLEQSATQRPAGAVGPTR
jgi:ankyrin repeat protein